MKRIIITSTILLLAFTVNAQSNRSRSESNEPAKKEEVKRPSRSSGNTTRSTTVQPTREDRNQKTQTEQSRIRQQPQVERSSSSRNPSNQQIQERRDQRPEVIDERRSNNQRRDAIRPRVEHSDPVRNQNRVTTPRSETPRQAYRPKTGPQYERERRVYTPNRERRVTRPAPKSYQAYKPIEYRREHYVYRIPPRQTITWNIHMYNEYARFYPDYHLWYYPVGYRIHTVSAYDAYKYIGEVARIYGEVFSAWHARETDEYYLYIGGPWPHQDFTIILEGPDARRFSRHPLRYFNGRHVSAIGLVSVFEGKPEMFLKKKSQIDVY